MAFLHLTSFLYQKKKKNEDFEGEENSQFM